ncbi:hypothetical protein [Actinomadura sp. NPDC049753]|uniref:hypothetical protein n=1 Tax=Actinomadura sp. NPDC049753 TaxID=3154739 RepID=UPI0034384F14
MPPTPSAAENTEESGERTPGPSAGWTAGFHAVGNVLTQTTLLAAVLYYFGWARSYALYPYFGVEPSMLRLSVTDYVLRSVVVTIRPSVISALIVLGVAWAHRALKLAVARRPPEGRRLVLRIVTIACGGIGTALSVAGVLGFYDVVVYSIRYPLVPIFIGSGIALVMYAAAWSGATPQDPSPGRLGGFQAAVAVVLGAVLVLWTVGVFAHLDGADSARTIEQRLGERPVVVLYSRTDLGLSAPRTGLQMKRLRIEHGEYLYRYTGLRLLTYSNGRYVLLPEHWGHARDPAFVLDERDGLRFEIRHA